MNGRLLIPDKFDNYFQGEDRVWYSSKEMIGVCVYKQGKFAEIILDKKKRPETFDEFIDFFDDWEQSELLDFNQFLNQYEL
jgi:hypothetical protein